MTEYEEWGPLGPLAGEWEGSEGLDVSYSNANGAIVETPYREKMTLKPFGPVENGAQVLYGLDYRTAAWRTEVEEENPFHTEVGYWLWDVADLHVMRSFMIPRGSTVLAGGTATPESRSFGMQAECGSEMFGILSNPFLAKNARTKAYACTITLHDDGSWSYEETSSIEHARMGGELLAHTDRNTMRRVG